MQCFNNRKTTSESWPKTASIEQIIKQNRHVTKQNTKTAENIVTKERVRKILTHDRKKCWRCCLKIRDSDIPFSWFFNRMSLREKNKTGCILLSLCPININFKNLADQTVDRYGSRLMPLSTSVFGHWLVGTFKWCSVLSTHILVSV